MGEEEGKKEDQVGTPASMECHRYFYQDYGDETPGKPRRIIRERLPLQEGSSLPQGIARFFADGMVAITMPNGMQIPRPIHSDLFVDTVDEAFGILDSKMQEAAEEEGMRIKLELQKAALAHPLVGPNGAPMHPGDLNQMFKGPDVGGRMKGRGKGR